MIENMKHRFFHPESASLEARVSFAGDEFHHAARVRRLRVGEEIEIFDGKGWSGTARIESLDRRSLTAVVVGVGVESREPQIRLTLSLAIIQPEKFELVLQKGTELGVVRFVPLITDRGEVPVDRILGKTERWRKILLEAAKQCGRSVLPEVAEPLSFVGVCGFREPVILFDADSEPSTLSGPIDRATILIGPEGGWSDEELAIARGSGATFQRLGPRRMRAETAAIAAVTTLGVRFGDLS